MAYLHTVVHGEIRAAGATAMRSIHSIKASGSPLLLQAPPWMVIMAIPFALLAIVLLPLFRVVKVLTTCALNCLTRLSEMEASVGKLMHLRWKLFIHITLRGNVTSSRKHGTGMPRILT